MRIWIQPVSYMDKALSLQSSFYKDSSRGGGVGWKFRHLQAVSKGESVLFNSEDLSYLFKWKKKME